MVPTDGWTLGAAGVLGVAALQLVLARWRDLGPATSAGGGILVVLASPAAPTAVWIGIASAALVAAAAWARGATHGIGHPSMNAVVFGFVIAVAAACRAVPSWPPAEITGATAIGVVGLVATTIAMRTPGPRHRPVRWVGEIPIGVPK